MRVDIMGFHIISISDSSVYRISISNTVHTKRWFSKISLERGVWLVSWFLQKFLFLLSLFFIKCLSSLFLRFCFLTMEYCLWSLFYIIWLRFWYVDFWRGWLICELLACKIKLLTETLIKTVTKLYKIKTINNIP
jgi:hypothetical protein